MKHPSVPTKVGGGIKINLRYSSIANWLHRAIGAFLLMVVCAPAFSQDQFVGNWGGHIELPGLRLEIRVEFETVEGVLRGAIDIPAQAVTGMALDKIEIDENAFDLSSRNVPGTSHIQWLMIED